MLSLQPKEVQIVHKEPQQMHRARSKEAQEHRLDLHNKVQDLEVQLQIAAEDNFTNKLQSKAPFHVVLFLCTCMEIN